MKEIKENMEIMKKANQEKEKEKPVEKAKPKEKPIQVEHNMHKANVRSLAVINSLISHSQN